MITPRQPKLKIHIQKKYDLCLVFLIGLINSFALSPSITSSLGITSLEDGPIQPAIVYKDPSIFLNDFHASEFQRLMWTTSTKWLPAVLYKYLNIDPIIFHVFFTYAQTVLMLIGTFYLASSLFKSRQISYISVCFIIMFSPYFNNFASYGDQFFMPYGTWISIGPLLLAWANSVDNKRQKTLIWLIIGASIHPAMALCASFAILASKNFPKISYKALKEIVILFSPALLFSFIALLVKNTATSPIVPAEWFLNLKNIFHWYAWKLSPETRYFETTSYTILLILSTYILTKSRIFSFSEEVKNSTKKLFILFILLYLIQAFSFQLEISGLYSISLGRFSIFTAIYSSIIYAGCISKLLRNNRGLKGRFLSPLLVFCILIPSFLNFALLGFILVTNDIKQKISDRALQLLSIFIILLSLIFSRANYNDAWWIGSKFDFIPNSIFYVPNYLPLRMLQELSQFFWVPIIIFLVFYLSENSFKKRTFLFYFIILVFSLSSIIGRFILSERRDGSHSDWIAVQVWAKQNTSNHAKFIVNSGLDTYESWTSLSRRPRLIADQNAGFLYFYTKEDAQYDGLRAQLPRAPESNSDSEEIVEFYDSFKQIIGGDFLVWKNTDTELNYPIVYLNRKFLIYKLELSK